MDGILAALGLNNGSIVGGFLGAMISLKFIEGQSVLQRASTVAAGTIGAAYLAPLAANAFELNAKLEGGLAFLVGVLFMSFAGALIKATPEIVEALRKKFVGG